MEALLWERLGYQTKVVKRKITKHVEELNKIHYRLQRLRLEKSEQYTHTFDELRLKV